MNNLPQDIKIYIFKYQFKCLLPEMTPILLHYYQIYPYQNVKLDSTKINTINRLKDNMINKKEVDSREIKYHKILSLIINFSQVFISDCLTFYMKIVIRLYQCLENLLKKFPAIQWSIHF